VAASEPKLSENNVPDVVPDAATSGISWDVGSGIFSLSAPDAWLPTLRLRLGIGGLENSASNASETNRSTLGDFKILH